ATDQVHVYALPKSLKSKDQTKTLYEEVNQMTQDIADKKIKEDGDEAKDLDNRLAIAVGLVAADGQKKAKAVEGVSLVATSLDGNSKLAKISAKAQKANYVCGSGFYGNVGIGFGGCCGYSPYFNYGYVAAVALPVYTVGVAVVNYWNVGYAWCG